MLTGRQIHQARELLGWSRAELARNAFLSLAVVEVMEEHESTFMLLDEQMATVCRVIDGAGVEFGVDAGVHLRKAKRDAYD